MAKLVTAAEREKICNELSKFRGQVTLKTEMALREIYNCDDFGLVAKRAK